MHVSAIMNRDVITVRDDAPILQAITLMLDHRISGLPVVDAEGRLAGILTEGDLLRRSETETERRHSWWWTWLHGFAARAGDYVHTHTRRVADLMTVDVLTVGELTPLDAAVDIMESRRVKRLPVVIGDEIVGIISRSDLLRELADRLGRLPAGAAPVPDDALTERVAAELEQQDWFRPGGIAVAVRDGVVHLSGAYADARERDAVRVAAQNVPGVKAVREHLTFIDPTASFIY